MDYVDKSIFAAFSTFCLRESKGHPNAVPILERITNATNPEVFKLMMQITVLLLVQYYLCFTLPFCCAIVYVVQKVYLRTSRQLRIGGGGSRARRGAGGGGAGGAAAGAGAGRT